MKLYQAYQTCLQLLTDSGIDEADFKTLCLVCHTAGIRNCDYAAHKEIETDFRLLEPLVQRVISGVPLQYVLGKWDFYESEFAVGKGVLIPRPETEELVDLTIKAAVKMSSPVVVDLCAGSGCIGLSIAAKLPGSTVYCIEKSEDAFFYLQKNAESIPNAVLLKADIRDVSDLPHADIVVSNPPYIRSDALGTLQQEVQYEPRMALDGGADGLDFYRVINDRGPSMLRDDGLLFLEIGEEQAEDVRNILTHFTDIIVQKDLYGNDRFVIAVKRS